jgi:Flp pilus assembly protein TadG
MLRPARNGRRKRRGSLTLELLFVLPILLAVLLGTIEFSMMAVARQQLLAASREAARVASQGGNFADIQATVQTVLPGRAFANATIVAQITDDAGNPIPSGQPVAVCVGVRTGDAVPDLLRFFGLSLSEQRLTACSVSRKE